MEEDISAAQAGQRGPLWDPRSPFGRFMNLLGALLEALVLVVVIFVTIPAIVEIAARQQFQGALTSRIQSLKSQYVDLTRNGVSDETAKTEIQVLKQQLLILDELASALNLLIVNGTYDGRYALLILQRLDSSSRHLAIKAITAPAGSPSPASAERSPSPGSGLGLFEGDGHSPSFLEQLYMGALSPVLFSILFVFLRPQFLSTEHLLAIAIMGCGAIGAIIAGLRANTIITFRNLSLGLAAGFVTFLGIKGGKHFFLVQGTIDQVAFNPYSSAFAGLLAGLFTERAYSLLSSVVDELIKKVQAAMK